MSPIASNCVKLSAASSATSRRSRTSQAIAERTMPTGSYSSWRPCTGAAPCRAEMVRLALGRPGVVCSVFFSCLSPGMEVRQ